MQIFADLPVDTSNLCVKRNGITLTLAPISFKILRVVIQASPSTAESKVMHLFHVQLIFPGSTRPTADSRIIKQ